jgi:hypothetical protein
MADLRDVRVPTSDYVNRLCRIVKEHPYDDAFAMVLIDYGRAVERALAAQPAPGGEVALPEGWRVHALFEPRYAAGCPWEVYDPTGSGGVVHVSAVTDDRVRRLLDALAATPPAETETGADGVHVSTLPKELFEWLDSRGLIPEIDEDGTFDVDDLIVMLDEDEAELIRSAQPKPAEGGAVGNASIPDAPPCPAIFADSSAHAWAAGWQRGAEAVAAMRTPAGSGEAVAEIQEWPNDFTKIGVVMLGKMPPPGTKFYAAPLSSETPPADRMKAVGWGEVRDGRLMSYTHDRTDACNVRIFAGSPLADAEALIRECVPGGSICDPQQVADNIREYFGRLSGKGE